jgi:hypothetical protein
MQNIWSEENHHAIEVPLQGTKEVVWCEVHGTLFTSKLQNVSELFHMLRGMPDGRRGSNLAVLIEHGSFCHFLTVIMNAVHFKSTEVYRKGQHQIQWKCLYGHTNYNCTITSRALLSQWNALYNM